MAELEVTRLSMMREIEAARRASPGYGTESPVDESPNSGK